MGILPPSLRTCIEARAIDAIQGLQEAIGAGEQYEAVLLDSIHTEEQVWAELSSRRSWCAPGA